MSFIDSFRQNVDSIGGTDIDAVTSFMDEMVTARTSAFYDDARMERYRSIDLSVINELVRTNTRSRSGIRIARARDSIRYLPEAVHDDYF